MSSALLIAGIFTASELSASDENFRVLSWNISGDAFVAEPSEFRALIRWGDPDIVLLDEVDPAVDLTALETALAGLRGGSQRAWNINFGASGGRQRTIVASRDEQEALPEFAAIVAYPEEGKNLILSRAPEEQRAKILRSMESGIPVNGAVILRGEKRLLVLITDLTCCGDGPDSWEEHRRRVEANAIRGLIRQILNRTTVDGVVFAGDFNLVESTFPMTLLTGPYPAPHFALIPAEIYHPDGMSTWTWDGRGTPFPSDTLDYQFYGPWGLKMHSGFILDTEQLAPGQLKRFELETNTVGLTGAHRPLLVEYSWR